MSSWSLDVAPRTLLIRGMAPLIEMVNRYLDCNVRYLPCSLRLSAGRYWPGAGAPSHSRCCDSSSWRPTAGLSLDCALYKLYTSWPPHVRSLCNRSYKHILISASGTQQYITTGKYATSNWIEATGNVICVATPSEKLWCCENTKQKIRRNQSSAQPSRWQGVRGWYQEVRRVAAGGISANCCHQDRDQTMTRVCRDHAPCGRSVEN